MKGVQKRKSEQDMISGKSGRHTHHGRHDRLGKAVCDQGESKQRLTSNDSACKGGTAVESHTYNEISDEHVDTIQICAPLPPAER